MIYIKEFLKLTWQLFDAVVSLGVNLTIIVALIQLMRGKFKDWLTVNIYWHKPIEKQNG